MVRIAFAALLGIQTANAQNCSPIDHAAQERAEQACQQAGGQWARHGVLDHLCGVYSCAERTKDGGKSCRNRLDCEHLCVTDAPPRIGAEAPGKCTAVKTQFGCFTHVDGGRIVGRVCME
jgi:hypothetical protein